jgi:hypothetical protein
MNDPPTVLVGFGEEIEAADSRRSSMNDPPTVLVGFEEEIEAADSRRSSMNDPPTVLVGFGEEIEAADSRRSSMNDPPTALVGLRLILVWLRLFQKPAWRKKKCLGRKTSSKAPSLVNKLLLRLQHLMSNRSLLH